MLLPLSAVGIVLAFASVAWACIAVKGPTEITSVVRTSEESSEAACATDKDNQEPCAAPGDFIKVSATGAEPNVEFFLHMRNYRRTSTMSTSCYGSRIDPDVRLTKKSRTSDLLGNIAALKGQIPLTTKPTSDFAGRLGPAMVCFIDGKRDITTQADSITII
jgi:hypothetical protein